MSDQLRPYRFLNERLDVATGFSSMVYVTVAAGQLFSEIRYVSGQTGFILGASIVSGTTVVPIYGGVTLGLPVPTAAIGGAPMVMPGPVPYFLGSQGSSGVVFNVSRFFNSSP